MKIIFSILNKRVKLPKLSLKELEEKVLIVQNLWADSIVKIGKAYIKIDLKSSLVKTTIDCECFEQLFSIWGGRLLTNIPLHRCCHLKDYLPIIG